MFVYVLFGLLIILFTQKHKSLELATPNINQRIEILKQSIIEEIQYEQKRATETVDNMRPNVFYDYNLPGDDSPVKPIMKYSTKKKHGHRSKKKEKIKDNMNGTKTTNHTEITPTKFKYSRITPADVFYRRLFYDEEERQKPQKWTHCLDLISPYITGLKKDLSLEHVPVKDKTVARLIQLISINTTGHSKDDIVSILYQISNLNLRIFQWDSFAITTLFNVIIEGNMHDFRSLKRGLKNMLDNWHLDVSNISSVANQVRIFRPPCIEVNALDGSTKSSRSIRYTKPTTINSDDESCSE